jgi:hypothetical protein
VSATSSETARYQTTDADDKGQISVSEGVRDFSNNSGSGVSKSLRRSDPSVTDSPGLSKMLEPTETRFFGLMTYSKGGQVAMFGARPAQPWVAMDYAKVAAAMCISLPTSALGGLSEVGGAPPSDVLDALRVAGATLAQIGTDEVRGTATTHWKVTSPQPSTTSTIPGCDHPQYNQAISVSYSDVEIWTDGQNRLRRVKKRMDESFNDRGLTVSSASSTEAPQHITVTSTTDLYDFGIPVDIQVPPADQTYDVTAALIAATGGPGDVTDGDWREVAHGQLNGVPWSVSFANSSNGWRCYEAQGAPITEAQGADPPVDPTGAPMPKHAGRPSNCIPPGRFGDPTSSVFVDGTDASGWTMVGAVPDGTSKASVVLVDGTSSPLTIDGTIHLFQWTGAVEPKAIRTDDTTCGIAVSSAPTDGLGCNVIAFAP